MQRQDWNALVQSAVREGALGIKRADWILASLFDRPTH